jgi:hypothetical protein
MNVVFFRRLTLSGDGESGCVKYHIIAKCGCIKYKNSVKSGCTKYHTP